MIFLLTPFSARPEPPCARRRARHIVRSTLASCALVGKSLLREGAGKRFEVHELLRQFSAEKLVQMREEHEETQASILARHGHFYQRLGRLEEARE